MVGGANFGLIVISEIIDLETKLTFLKHCERIMGVAPWQHFSLAKPLG